MKRQVKRPNGIQSKKGKLYAVISFSTIVNGQRKQQKKWYATGLTDIPANYNEAENLRNRKLIDLYSRKQISSGQLAISDAVYHFLANKEKKIRNTTYSSYLHRGKHIADYFGNISINELKTEDAENFLNYLLTSGNNAITHVRKGSETGLSARTVKDIRLLFSQIFDYCIDNGIVSENVVKKAKPDAELISQKKYTNIDGTNFFDQEECKLFLTLVKDHPLYLLFVLAIRFGLRREEAIGLKWSNVDLNRKTLRVASTVTIGTRVNQQDDTKTDESFRTYPLTDDLCELFKNEWVKQTKFREFFGNTYIENDYVFKHENGKMYYPDYPSKLIKKIIKKHPELPQDVHFHSLRYSCVSNLIDAGFDVKKIQAWVGHKDIETTLKIYAKIKSEKEKQKIGEQLAKMYAGL
ncbi:MAG: site-specific integrase [Lachnospiraceae bacterium]|nr:site-specific integrase [Lachnospiraceae bacterium]